MNVHDPDEHLPIDYKILWDDIQHQAPPDARKNAWQFAMMFGEAFREGMKRPLTIIDIDTWYCTWMSINYLPEIEVPGA